MVEAVMSDALLQEQLSEVDREIAIRKNVYPKWIARKRMSKDMADRCIHRLVSARNSLKAQSQFGQVMKAEFDGSGAPVRVLVQSNDVARWYVLEQESDDE